MILAVHHSVGKGRQGLSSWLKLQQAYATCPPEQAFAWLVTSWSTDSYVGRQRKAEGHLATEAHTQLDADWKLTSEVSSLHCRSFQERVRPLWRHTTRALCSMCLWMPAYPTWWVRSDPCLIRKEKFLSQTFGLGEWSEDRSGLIKTFVRQSSLDVETSSLLNISGQAHKPLNEV